MYKYHDGTGYGHPWELIPLGNYTLRTKDGGVPGYNTEFEMAVRYILTRAYAYNCLLSTIICGY